TGVQTCALPTCGAPQAEPRARLVAGLDHAVRVEQYAVTGFEADLVHLTGGLGETCRQAQRRLRRPLECLGEQTVATDEQRSGMTAVAPSQHTCGHVQLSEDTRAELLRKPRRQRIVHGAHEFVEACPAAPGIAAACHG